MMKVLPWLLAATHAVLVIGMLASKPVEPYPGPRVPGEMSLSGWHTEASSMVAGRSLHHDDLSTVLLGADFPAVIVIIGLDLLLAPVSPSVSPVTASYVDAALWLVLGSLWWFAIGKMSGRVRNRPRE